MKIYALVLTLCSLNAAERPPFLALNISSLPAHAPKTYNYVAPLNPDDVDAHPSNAGRSVNGIVITLDEGRLMIGQPLFATKRPLRQDYTVAVNARDFETCNLISGVTDLSAIPGVTKLIKTDQDLLKIDCGNSNAALHEVAVVAAIKAKLTSGHKINFNHLYIKGSLLELTSTNPTSLIESLKFKLRPINPEKNQICFVHGFLNWSTNQIGTPPSRENPEGDVLLISNASHVTVTLR